MTTTPSRMFLLQSGLALLVVFLHLPLLLPLPGLEFLLVGLHLCLVPAAMDFFEIIGAMVHFQADKMFIMDVLSLQVLALPLGWLITGSIVHQGSTSVSKPICLLAMTLNQMVIMSPQIRKHLCF